VTSPNRKPLTTKPAPVAPVTTATPHWNLFAFFESYGLEGVERETYVFNAKNTKISKKATRNLYVKIVLSKTKFR